MFFILLSNFNLAQYYLIFYVLAKTVKNSGGSIVKKIYSLLLILLVTLGALTACGEQTEQGKEENNSAIEKTEEAAGFPVTIQDALDNKVVIEEKPEKIVSLIPSNTEIAFALGLGEEVVGVSDFDNYPEEATTKEKIGGMEINLEKIISLKPHLVLAHASSAHNSTEGLQQLRDSGINVLIVNDAQNFDQVFDSIAMIGKATGESKKSDEIISGMKEKLAEIKAKAGEIKEKKKVLVEVSAAPDNFTTGKNTFMDEMISLINAENIANDQEGWIKMDQEAMVNKNPDVIITTYGYYVNDAAEQVLSRKGWENVSAVKNKQVIDVDSDRVTRSGPRIVEGVEELAKAVYPEVFK
jgi:iron complex transport system substrate-binding protein